MNSKSRSRRCAMLVMSPVRRLSMPTTEWPRSSSASQRCDPMNPAAPVTTLLGMQKSQSRLVGGSAKQPAHDREPHDLQVERDRPVLDVIQVELDPLFERRVATPPVDLRPAGDPGLDLVSQHVLRDAVLELLHEERSLR